MQQETLFRLKSAADPWSFTGWASTPDVDLVGDIVEPAGARYELPLPLLWQHKHDEPVGAVRDAHVSHAGIRITGRITPEAQRAAEAQALLRDGALALSVGFLAEKSEPLPTGGRRFTAWRWTELSLVSVPANPQARIGKGLVMGSRPEAKAVPAPRPAVQAVGDVVTTRALELFGEAVGQTINEAVRPLRERIKQLEARQTMHFAGVFQRAMSYPAGATVKSGDGVFVALRNIEAGKAEPQRQGSGWDRLA